MIWPILKCQSCTSAQSQCLFIKDTVKHKKALLLNILVGSRNTFLTIIQEVIDLCSKLYLHAIAGKASCGPCRAQIEANLIQYLLPLPSRVEEETAWTDRFLVVYDGLSERSRLALIHISHINDRRPSPYVRYIEACRRYNVREQQPHKPSQNGA